MATKTAKEIPFSVSLSTAPIARDEMDEDTFHAMMAKGLAQAKANDSRPVADVSGSMYAKGFKMPKQH